MAESDWNQTMLARMVGSDDSTLSRIFAGLRMASVDLAVGIVTLCDARWEIRREVRALAREAEDLGEVETDFRRGGRERLACYEFQVLQAEVVGEYATHRLPWPVQTPAYARAVSRERPLTVADETKQCAPGGGDLLERCQPRPGKGRLTGSVCQTEWLFLIQESALRLLVGSPSVMAAQLRRLLWLTGQPHVQIRVVPDGLHVVGAGGPFGLLCYERAPAVVHRDEASSDLYVQDRDVVVRHAAILDHLAGLAFDVERSRELISRLAEKYENATWDDWGSPPEGNQDDDALPELTHAKEAG
jgi:hypothetical protein